MGVIELLSAVKLCECYPNGLHEGTSEEIHFTKGWGIRGDLQWLLDLGLGRGYINKGAAFQLH